jgi:hypothetical protein
LEPRRIGVGTGKTLVMAANPQERFGLAIHLSQARLQDTQPAEGARMQPERP